MALNQVSNQVLQAVLGVLSNSTGINAGLATNWRSYGLPGSVPQIQWTGSQPLNFCIGQIDDETMDQSGIITYPFFCLYVLESQNTNDEKFHQFSGPIRCVFEATFSWVPMKGLLNFDAYGNCFEDVFLDVINRVQNQGWGKPLVYNGQVHCRRGPVRFGGQNWRQKIAFSLIFGLNQ